MTDFVQRDRNHPSVTIWSFCVSDPAPAPAGGGDAGAAAHTVCLSIVAASLSKHEQNEQGCGASPTDPVQQAGPGTNSWNGPNISVRKRARIKLCYLPRTAQ